MVAEVFIWQVIAIGEPLLILTLLCILIICYHRRYRWRPADVLIATMLLEGIIKQTVTFTYAILTLFKKLDSHSLWCSGIVGIVTSVHITQAGTLATCVFSGVLAMGSPLMYRNVLTRPQVSCHLVSLSIMGACLGITAVLAQDEKSPGFDEATVSPASSNDTIKQQCTLLPYEINSMYAVVWIILHFLFDGPSIIALINIIFKLCRLSRPLKYNFRFPRLSRLASRQQNIHRDLIGLSGRSPNSLARIGERLANNGGQNVQECTTNERDGNLQQRMTFLQRPPNGALPTLPCQSGLNSTARSSRVANCPLPNARSVLNTGLSRSSDTATTSFIEESNNTSRPCVSNPNAIHIAPRHVTSNGSNQEACDENDNGCCWTLKPSCTVARPTDFEEMTRMMLKRLERLRLWCIICMVVICYAVNHLPVLVLNAVGLFAPWLLPKQWPLSSLVLWAGVVEECLLPILLYLCDRNFRAWVADIHICRGRRSRRFATRRPGIRRTGALPPSHITTGLPGAEVRETLTRPPTIPDNAATASRRSERF